MFVNTFEKSGLYLTSEKGGNIYMNVLGEYNERLTSLSH
jgi:hypothetical protein